MTPIPQEPTGNSGLVQTVKGILRRLREQTIITDPTLRIERTANGTKLTVVGVAKSGSSQDDLCWL
jgi:hypothetical protein